MIKFIGSILIALLFVLNCNAQVIDKLLTFDGPEHHTLSQFGFPIIGGGEDVIVDDSLLRHEDNDNDGEFSEGDVFFWIIDVSDFKSSNVASQSIHNTLVLFLSFIVGADEQLLPNPDGFSILNSSLTDPAGIGADTMGIVIGLNPTPMADSFGIWMAPPPIGPLSIDYFDLGEAFEKYHWEMTLGTGSFAAIQDNGFAGTAARAAFTVISSSFNVDEWLSVDVINFDSNIYFGDFTLDAGLIGSPASEEEQEGGWSFLTYMDFITNPIR